MPEWKNTDPRVELIDRKRASIVVVYQDADGPKASLAHVETKHSWSVFVTLPVGDGRHEFVGPDIDWDDSWQWTLAPQVP